MSVKGNRIFSGEPLPVPPRVSNAELEAFHRKIIDYLRRLTGKLERFVDGGGGAGVLVFSAILDTNQSFSGSTDFPIVFETVLRQDSPFTFSGPTHVIGLTEAGFYVLELDIRVFKNIPMVLYVAEVDSGGAPTTIIGHSYTQDDFGLPENSASMMVPFVISGATEIGVFVVYNGSLVGNDVYADGTRVLVTFYPAEA